jgi:hypothetical protein
MGWQLDMTDQTAETVEREGKLEADWYLCVLDDTHEDKNGQQVFELVVKKGLVTKARYADERHFERLNNPEYGKDEQAQRFLKKKANCWASRLGLLKQNAFGRVVNVEWEDCIGNAYVLKITHRQYADKDKLTGQPTGAMQTAVECGFNLFPPDHEKIPEEVRKGLELPPVRKALHNTASPIYSDQAATGSTSGAAQNGATGGAVLTDAGAGAGGADGTPVIDTSDL